MKFRRKHNSCLNCNYPLDDIYNYCPNCGQENTDSRIPFVKLIGEFLSNYFALDSRFGNTVKPFFFKPGHLTLEYMKGRRTAYAHPIRIYLVISLFYFAIFSLTVTKIMKENPQNEVINFDESKLKRFNNLPDSTRQKISDVLDEGDIDDINEEISRDSLEAFKSALLFLNDSDKREIVSVLSEEEVRQLNLQSPDSVDEMSLLEFMTDLNTSDKKVLVKKPVKYLNGRYFKLINSLADNDDLTEDQIVDSLKMDNLSDFQRYVTKQIVRINRSNDEAVVSYIIKNMSIMMFLLIPMFALILKLLYIRRNIYYLLHLINSLHIHSFAFLVYGIMALILAFIFNGGNGVTSLIAITLVTIYSYVSFLRVYKQHWFKTTIKFFATGFLYGFLILTFFIGELFISFLLF